MRFINMGLYEWLLLSKVEEARYGPILFIDIVSMHFSVRCLNQATLPGDFILLNLKSFRKDFWPLHHILNK